MLNMSLRYNNEPYRYTRYFLAMLYKNTPSCEQQTVHSLHQTQLEKKKPPLPTPPHPTAPHHTAPTTKKGEAPPLHDSTSHWLHGNSIPKIGGRYFWPGLIALPKNILASRYKVPPHWVIFMDIRFEPVKLKKLKSARTLSVGYALEWGDYCNEATMRWEKSGLPRYSSPQNGGTYQAWRIIGWIFCKDRREVVELTDQPGTGLKILCNLLGQEAWSKG
jgi:hypothetical protein